MIIDPYRYARAFNPFDYGTVVAWYSDTGSDPSIWPDLSGNGNDATQATMSKQPAIVAGAEKGRQVRRFDGADDTMASSAVDLAALSGLTVLAAVKLTGAQDFPMLATCAAAGTGGFELRFYGTFAQPQWCATEDGPVISTSLLGVSACISATFSDAGNQIALRVNGGSAATQAVSGSLSANSAFRLGARSDGFYAGMDLFEIAIFSEALDTAHAAAVSALMAKWGIAP